MPSIDRLHAEYAAKGLKVLLVNLAEPRDTVARAVAGHGYKAQVLLDLDGRIADAYQVRATPTVYLVGPNGALLGGAIGPRPWAGPSGRALLQALLQPASQPAR